MPDQKYSGYLNCFTACIPHILSLLEPPFVNESRSRYSTLWDKSRSRPHSRCSALNVLPFQNVNFFYRKFVARHFGAVMVRKCSSSRRLRVSQSFVGGIRFERTREMSKSESVADPPDFMIRVRVRVTKSGNNNYLATPDVRSVQHDSRRGVIAS